MVVRQFRICVAICFQGLSAAGPRPWTPQTTMQPPTAQLPRPWGTPPIGTSSLQVEKRPKNTKFAIENPKTFFSGIAIALGGILLLQKRIPQAVVIVGAGK